MANVTIETILNVIDIRYLMNTNQLKTYAPKARLKFIEAIKTKLRTLGIEKGKIAEVERSGDFIFIQKQPFPKSIESPRQQIIQKIEKLDFEQVLEQYAYTWFNRLCAIRFMELHEGYLEHGYRVLSHSQRDHGLEFLDSAVEVAEYFDLDSKEIIDLKLEHKDDELYRKLLLAQCNQLHHAMPFLFDPVDSVTSLLLPDDLTRSDSIITDLVQQVDEESWQHVEIIGWLYQFYISELKDQVIGKVVATEDIPYATQLFTPNWIVKYMVQNSLGRYWLQTYPDTVVTIDGEEKRLKDILEYYIEPAEQEDSVKSQLAEITAKSIELSSIKVIDPASGSGHILVEAYDLLNLIYQSHGHRKRDIPKLILENNIFGLDIDDRAEQLTGFALMMKARQDDHRIFERGIHLNICAFQNSDELDADQIWQALNLNKAWQSGSHVDMFGQAQADLGAGETDPRYALIQDIIVKFKDAKAFGSLIAIDHSQEATLFDLKTALIDLIVNGDSLQKGNAEKLLPIVEQAWILSQRYDAVIANPPYMGFKYFSKELKKMVSDNFPMSKADLYTVFIDRNLQLIKPNSFVSMITIPNWMFLSSFEDVRSLILNSALIDSFIHIGRGVWGSDFGSCAFVLTNNVNEKYLGYFKCLFDKQGSIASNSELKERFFDRKRVYLKNASDFKKIPNQPIAYWIDKKLINIFNDELKIDDIAPPRVGMMTTDNNRFLRNWYEVSLAEINFNAKSIDDSIKSKKKWFPYNKGGNFKKWYGNNDLVVNWGNHGEEIASTGMTSFRGKNFYFREGITWGSVSVSKFSCRYTPSGKIFDIGGSSVFPSNEYLYIYLAVLNSNVGMEILRIFNSTANFQSGDIRRVPLVSTLKSKIDVDIIKDLIEISKNDYNIFEQSYDFKKNFLVTFKESLISSSYRNCVDFSRDLINQVKMKEELINSVIIEEYSLSETVISKIPDKEITLFVNPSYRYEGDLLEIEKNQRLQSDTIAELISYAIGCMMGRYSLDRDGLVYAHEGNLGFDQLVVEGAYQKFPADNDGILPLLDEERFPDDVYTRFEQFIATAWDKETLLQNLDFIAESLRLYNIKAKNGESSVETIRRYLSNHFYKDQHLKTYKNRPIYWLFSSGKQKAFECLVYMHRFNDTTLAKMRTQYVLPLMGQLTARAQFLADAEKDTSLSPAEKTKYAKEADSLHKKLDELKDFDAELKHHVEQKITIDLDDGVKVNYGKFAKLLAEVKKVTGNKE